MNLRHILTKKSSKRKRNLRKSGFVNPGGYLCHQEDPLPYG